MKRFLAVAAAALALALTIPIPTPTLHAQGVVDVARFMPATPVFNSLGADDLDVAIIVKYVGTSTSADVAVAADGDLTFRDTAVAEDDFECPVSGGLGGVIDVANAACNTLGEVVDTINGACTGCTSTNWRAVIVDGLRSDSSNDALVTIAATEATGVDGLLLKRDTDVIFTSEIALIPQEYRTSIKPWLGGRVTNDPPFVENPFASTQTRFTIANFTSTYAAGSSAYEIYSVKMRLRHGAVGQGEEYKVYSTANAATTVNKIHDYTSYGILSRPNAILVLRAVNTNAMASTVHYAYGQQFKY